MSKITHMVALTQENVETIFSSLMTVQEFCTAGLMVCKQTNDTQGIANAYDSLDAIQRVLQKIEPRIHIEDRQLVEIEMEKTKAHLSDIYNPRREF